jgi:hypothetical protein
VCDSGNFSYHLDKLVGHYVEETGEGYRLRNSGRKIVRSQTKTGPRSVFSDGKPSSLDVTEPGDGA